MQLVNNSIEFVPGDSLINLHVNWSAITAVIGTLLYGNNNTVDSGC